MNKIDTIILKASLVGPKTRDEKDFRQVWFTRPEMRKAIELALAEVLEIAEPMPGSGDLDDVAFAAFCNEIRETFGVK